MAKVQPVPCPCCSGNVTVNPSAGGRGTNDLTSYSADCDRCGMLVDHLSDTGRKDSAVREYNRWARAYVPPVTTASITVRGGYGAYDSASVPVSPLPVVLFASRAPKAGNEARNREQARERRMKFFAVRAEPTPKPDFEGEKTICVTRNERKEYRTSLAPHEARKLFELLRTEFGF